MSTDSRHDLGTEPSVAGAHRSDAELVKEREAKKISVKALAMLGSGRKIGDT